MSNALAEPPSAPPKPPSIRGLLTGDRFKAEIANALPKHLAPERFIRVALTAMSRTPGLNDCDSTSFFKCLLDLSAAGLEPDGRRAHLIPYRNNRLGITECQLIIDWKGLVELAKRSGDVKSWRAELVCENDGFTWVNGTVNHMVNWREDRGKMQCVYSHVTLADGTSDYEVMTMAEVNAIRARSRASNAGPWTTDYNEMAKKTVIRRHSKRLTLSPEFHNATEADFDALPQVNGREVATARPQLFPLAPADSPPAAIADAADLGGIAGNASEAGASLPRTTPEAAPDESARTTNGAGVTLDIGGVAPAGKAPARRAAAPKPAAPPPPDESDDAIPFGLSGEPDTTSAWQRLSARAKADNISHEALERFLAKNNFPRLAMLSAPECAEVSSLYGALLEEAK